MLLGKRDDEPVERERVDGTIDNIIFYNDSTSYAVLELLCDDGLLICAVGNIPAPVEGERLNLIGRWTYHREFGKQLVFEHFERELPTDDDDIYKFLTSALKGVGPKLASRIVDKFGKDTFEVIETHPEWLADIQGITHKKAVEIAENFNRNKGVRDILELCKNYMNVEDAMKLYRKLGPFASGILLENPYILCEGTEPVPFSFVDNMAMEMGYNVRSESRIRLGFLFVLQRQTQIAGHTCLARAHFLDLAAKMLNLEYDFLDGELSRYIREGVISNYTVGDEEYVLTNETAEDEDYIAKKIRLLEDKAISFGIQDVGALIEKAECYTGYKYAKDQRTAIAEALLGGVMILTGGPGTGKTTVVKAIISIFESLGLKTVLAAPTGRAAKRLSETTGEEAKTIHRLIDMERTHEREIRYGRCESNPISENVIIVDEVSMLDTVIAAAFLRAVRPGSRVIFIGDASQLPSVGGGNVLSDMLSSGKIRTVTLTEVFRQSKESLIVANAHRINQGLMPNISSTDSDFFFVRRDRDEDIKKTVADLITERLPRAYGRDIMEKIQTITPSKVGEGGVLALNEELQARLNPKAKHKAEKLAHGTLFREGDRVMQTVNNYEISWTRGDEEGYGIFNGDIGIVEKIINPEMTMIVNYDGKRVYYTFDLLSDLELAYAITVHKSQGSEYPVVIIPLYSCPPMLMSRNLIYTAVTRAKNMVIMVGRTDILTKMVENNREIKRFTTLRERLITYL